MWTLPPDVSDTVSDRLAALREVFEECGVLVARALAPVHAPVHAGLAPLAAVSSHLPSPAAVHEARTASSADANAFYSVCASVGCIPDISALLPFERWVTPPFESKRFDTWFYLCALPSPPDALHASADDKEVQHSQWLTPAAALQLHADGAFALAPPTVYVLQELVAFDTMQSVLSMAQRRLAREPHKLRPLHPHFGVDSATGQVYSTLVGDPDYPQPHPEADAVLRRAHADAAQFQPMRKHRILKHTSGVDASSVVRWSVQVEHAAPGLASL